MSNLLTERDSMVSSWQVFKAELWIIELTSLSDKVLKADNVGITIALLLTVIDATGTVKSVIAASICLRMVSIFVTKYFPRLLAKVGACKFGGSPSY